MEPLVLVTRTGFLCFVISKYLDYMQYYMMLLEHEEQIVVKDLLTVTWLDEDHIYVCLDTWLDYSFTFT